MKIAVNTRLLLKNKLEGIGWFTYETLSRITRSHPEHEFIFIFDRPFNDEFIFSSNVKPAVISPQARHPFLFYLWFEYAIPSMLKKTKADLFLSPDGYLSLSTGVPSLAVIHDLNFVHYPADLPWLITKYYTYYFQRFAQKAKRIATVSEFSKQDIINQYHIQDSKIDVVYNGVNESFHPIPENEIIETRKKYSSGKPYFIFVGSLHPRKNIVNLFKAFDIFKQNNSNDVQLVFVGEKKWWTQEIETAFQNMQFKNDVIFTGRLYSDELNHVIGSALSMTYVSTFEGFGIPILEGFRCGVPVITSDVTSMPEVAGDAALLVNPFSVDSISNALTEIAANPALRQSLIEKGMFRKQNFSWQQTADKLWESVEKAMLT